ncbi:MAG: SRPBCC family protein [Fimbriimonadaceae bacterium]
MSDDRTVRLHRVFRAPAERVWRAFVEPQAVERWMAPYGFLAEVYEMDVRPGGTYRMSFTNFENGTVHAFGGVYLEVVPNERLRQTDRFEDSSLPGEIVMQMTLREVASGTEMKIEQTGLPEAIPLDMCYLGWQESLEQLSRLVEHEIPQEP